jgi:hypothetical protein
MDSIDDAVEMTFRINFRDPIRVTYQNLTTETVGDLKKVVAEYYQIDNIDLLDLGRFMHEDELLIEQDRTQYTIYFNRKPVTPVADEK